MESLAKIYTKAVPSLITGEVIDELSKLPRKSFHLIISSPPYNIGKSYEKKQSLRFYLEWQEEVIHHLHALLDERGSLCWQVGNFVDKGEVFPLDLYFYHIFKKLGFKLRNRIIWRFNHGLHATKRFSGRYETLLWFTKNDKYVFNLDNVRIPAKYPGKRHFKGDKKGLPSGNPKGKNPSDFWDDIKQEFEIGMIDIPNVKANHPEKTEHPCQFPVELVERCVLAFTNENDSVLDPFGGVGSSALAAIKNNRNACSIDKSQSYTDIARQRIQALMEGRIKLRKIGTKIYQPTGKEKVAQIPIEWENENSR